MTEYVIADKNELTAVADAIRARIQSNEAMSLNDMVVSIGEISGGDGDLTKYEERINSLENDVKNINAVFDKIGQEGSIGYIENKTVTIMEETVLPYDAELSRYDGYDAIGSLSIVNGNYIGYINGITYQITYIKGASYWRYEGDGTPDFEVGDNDYIVYWIGEGPAPESITVSIVKPEEVIHTIDKKFLDEEFQHLPALANVLLSGGQLVAQAEYPFEEGVALFTISDLDYLVTVGTPLKVHFDGKDYECKLTENSQNGNTIVVFGNIQKALNRGDTGEPFCGVVEFDAETSEGSIVVLAFDEAETHTVGISLASVAGGSQSVVVDLDTYGIGQQILNLFSKGGGTATLENLAMFWDEVNLDIGTDVHLKMTYGEYVFDIGGVTRLITSAGNCGQLCWAFLATDDSGTSYMLNISIVMNGSDSMLTVKVS